MSTALMEDLGLDQASWENDEKDIALGGTIPEGKYHARLVHASEKTAGEYTIDEFKFEILHGPYKGKIIESELFHSGKTAESTEKAKTRRRSYYHRLGLLVKSEFNGQKKYALAPGKTHIRDCLGNECIIDVIAEEEHWKDKTTGAPKKMMKNKLAYYGVYKLDDPKVKDVPRGKSDQPMPAAASEPNLDGI